ncbi:hypothetical protein EJP617_32400 [Erwinia sp. Ejp617]|nr:hypothetical protein EJP617_32400 [Erwinia sp. Ejp617]
MPATAGGEVRGSSFISGCQAHINLTKISDLMTVFTEMMLSGYRGEDFC